MRKDMNKVIVERPRCGWRTRKLNRMKIKEAGEDVKLAPDMQEMSDAYLMNAKKTVFNARVYTSILLCVIWPALSVPAGVFSKSYFAFWVFIAS